MTKRKILFALILLSASIIAGAALAENGVSIDEANEELYVFDKQDGLFYPLTDAGFSSFHFAIPLLPAPRSQNQQQNETAKRVTSGSGIVFEDEIRIHSVSQIDGDLLVTVHPNTTYTCYRIVEYYQYCVPVRFSVGNDTIYVKPESTNMIILDEAKNNSSGAAYYANSIGMLQEMFSRNQERKTIEEVNGIPAKQYPNYYSTGDERYIGGQKGEVLTFGYFEGVKYIEETAVADATLLILGEKLSVSTIKTKNGYFVLDIANAEPGLYAVANDKLRQELSLGSIGMAYHHSPESALYLFQIH